MTLAENFVTYNMKAVASARARNEVCNICRVNLLAGFGDCGGQIGLDGEVAKAPLEEDPQELSSNAAPLPVAERTECNDKAALLDAERRCHGQHNS